MAESDVATVLESNTSEGQQARRGNAQLTKLKIGFLAEQHHEDLHRHVNTKTHILVHHTRAYKTMWAELPLPSSSAAQVGIQFSFE